MTHSDWQPLADHWQDIRETHLDQMVNGDPERFDRFSLRLRDLLMDFSKEKVTEETLALLEDLAKKKQVESKRDAMFRGDKINVSENQAVLHTALRAHRDDSLIHEGEDIIPGIHDVIDRMSDFCDGVRDGSIRSLYGRRYTDVVNIGIGGSDLGSVLVVQGLVPYWGGPRIRYVSNIDPAHVADVLAECNPDTTLVIVASKSFTTQETMTNAGVVREWLGDKRFEAQSIGVTAKTDRAREWGIRDEHIFPIGDWVGGRYSMWSGTGLSIMMAISPKEFKCLLKGARDMDNHFRTASIRENLPMMLGLIGAWRRVICGCNARVVVPYDHRLSKLPSYLQQLDMESNGKSVKVDGSPVDTVTGPMVWGEAGTNGQHAFFQLLHQGSDIIPVEFIIAAEGHETHLRSQHELLVANCFAQSRALMKGRSLGEVQEILANEGMAADQIATMAPHRVFDGDRPSTTIMHKKLTPYVLGRLIALYEHRVFVEAALWDINAFDQWGVELGKVLARDIGPAISDPSVTADIDMSTNGLIATMHELADMDVKSCNKP